MHCRTVSLVGKSHCTCSIVMEFSSSFIWFNNNHYIGWIFLENNNKIWIPILLGLYKNATILVELYSLFRIYRVKKTKWFAILLGCCLLAFFSCVSTTTYICFIFSPKMRIKCQISMLLRLGECWWRFTLRIILVNNIFF